MQLEQPDGEKLILDFVRRYQPDPIANRALAEVASFYFNAGKYDQAAQYFDRIPLNSLSREERARIAFQSGYSYFVGKDFARRKSVFRKPRTSTASIITPLITTSGLIYFFDGDYDRPCHFHASWSGRPAMTPIFRLTAQIFFAQARYDELIACANHVWPAGHQERQGDQAVDRTAYFEKQDYAVPCRT